MIQVYNNIKLYHYSHHGRFILQQYSIFRLYRVNVNCAILEMMFAHFSAQHSELTLDIRTWNLFIFRCCPVLLRVGNTPPNLYPLPIVLIMVSNVVLFSITLLLKTVISCSGLWLIRLYL